MSVHIIRGRQTVVVLTNKTGGAVALGDVVIISGADANSFVSTAVEGQSAECIGIVLEAIPNNDTGRILTHGYAPQINLDGAAALRDFVKTDGVVLQGTPVAAPETGVFAQVLEVGTTPAAIIWPFPMQAGGGGAAGAALITSLTNKSGAGVVLGDVVIVDSTTASSFTTTAVEGQFNDWVGVAQDSIADNAAGDVLIYGLTAQINLDGAAVLGDFIRTDGVATQGTPVDEWISGVFGATLGAGATPPAIINSMPQVGAWNLIAETVLVGSVVSVTFSAIPQTYRDLIIVGEVRTDRVQEFDQFNVNFNGDGGANYDWISIQANNNVVISFDARATTFIPIALTEGSTSAANCFAPFTVKFTGYKTASHKRYTRTLESGLVGNLSHDNDLIIHEFRGHWENTAPITSTVLTPNVGPNFVSTCRFTLYGIV